MLFFHFFRFFKHPNCNVTNRFMDEEAKGWYFGI